MLENLLHSGHRALWQSLTASLPTYAKTSGLVQRASKLFKPEDFLLTLLASVVSGKASYNQLVISLSGQASACTVSPQALHQRVNRSECGLESFLILCLVHICQWQWSHRRLASKVPFSRILIEDSSSLNFPKSNSHHFPAHGNASGQTAGCKINLAFDLLSGEILSNALHTATNQDKNIGWDLLDLISPNDLVVRDMGYFGCASFARIESLGAYWLSRLPLSVEATVEGGKSLVEILKSHRGARLDIAAKLTAKGHPVRLVAIRASDEEREARRRKIHAEAKDNGRDASARTLTLAAWHILVTNIPASMQGVEELVAIYSQRWQIEIVFRGWKDSLKMACAFRRKSSPQHLKGLALAGMIVLAIGVKIGISLARKEGQRYSLEKIQHSIGEKLTKITKLLDLSRFHPDPRHIKTQKRKRNSLAARLLELLR